MIVRFSVTTRRNDAYRIRAQEVFSKNCHARRSDSCAFLERTYISAIYKNFPKRQARSSKYIYIGTTISYYLALKIKHGVFQRHVRMPCEKAFALCRFHILGRIIMRGG